MSKRDTLRVLRLMSHLGTGGTEKQCLEVLEHAKTRDDLGVQIHLATYCTDPFVHVLDPPVGVRWHRLDRPWNVAGAVAAARALRPLLADYDVLHAMLWPSVYVARLARPRIPIVASVHNTVQPAGPYGLKRKLDRWMFRGTRLVFNSAAGRDALASPLGFDPSRVPVVPNGKRLYGGPFGPRRGVLCVARISPQKRHDILLSAIARLDDATRERLAPFEFVGQGTDADEFRRRCREVDARGLVEGVGEVRDVESRMARASLVVLPTDHEGMPNVVLEAWNTKTPVLASRAPGVLELIRDGHDGLLVDNTAEAWAEALRSFDPLDPRVEARVDAGRRRLEAEFSLDAVVEAWARIYRDAALQPTQL
ncbi:MAG: glycosyltransferase family 1 protein [Deltaproteobacteria bacterium]|nr:MAG: glycosyltransferase family 1 protein [Deltaproteobacteria bacterium]